MPQYDGQVVINTAISDAGLKEGSKDIEEAVKKMVKAVDGLSQSARIAMEKQGAAIVKANRAYREQEAEVERLRAELDKLSDAKIQSQEFQNIGKQIEAAEARLNKLKDAQDKFIAVGGKESSPTFKKRQIEIEELRNTIKYAKAEQDNLLASGGAYQPVDTSEMTAKLQAAENKLGDMRGSLNMAFDSMSSKMGETGEKGEKTASRITNAFRTSGSVMAGAIKKTSSAFGNLKNKATQAFSKMRNESGRSIKQLLKYTLGIRSLFVLFNRLRNYGSAAFKVLAADAEDVNSDLSQIKSSFSQFKNSIATGFQPIIHAITPFITSVINMFTQASTAVGTFFAVLTGQKYIYKAKELNESFAESTEDAAEAQEKLNKSLASYDKLDVISKQEENVSAAAQTADAFEKVSIDGNGITNIVDMLKDAWDKADFSDVSRAIGNKLNNALENLKWDNIKKNCKKVATSIGTFINGFIETPELGSNIGSTIAEALNTAVDGIYTFFDTVHWESVGKFVADGVNGLVITFDSKKLGKTIAKGINSGVKAIHGFVNEVKWGEVGKFIGDGITGWFEGLDVEELAQTVSDCIKGLLQTAANIFANTDGTEIGKKVGEFFNNIKWDEVLSDAGRAIWDGFKLAIDSIAGLIEENPLAGAILVAILGLKAKSIMGGLLGGLTGVSGAATGGAAAVSLKDFFTGPVTFNLGTATIAIATAAIGYNLGKKLYEAFPALADLADDIVEGVGDAYNGAKEFVEEGTQSGFNKFIGGMWDVVKHLPGFSEIEKLRPKDKEDEEDEELTDQQIREIDLRIKAYEMHGGSVPTHTENDLLGDHELDEIVNPFGDHELDEIEGSFDRLEKKTYKGFKPLVDAWNYGKEKFAEYLKQAGDQVTATAKVSASELYTAGMTQYSTNIDFIKKIGVGAAQEITNSLTALKKKADEVDGTKITVQAVTLGEAAVKNLGSLVASIPKEKTSTVTGETVNTQVFKNLGETILGLVNPKWISTVTANVSNVTALTSLGANILGLTTPLWMATVNVNSKGEKQVITDVNKTVSEAQKTVKNANLVLDVSISPWSKLKSTAESLVTNLKNLINNDLISKLNNLTISSNIGGGVLGTANKLFTIPKLATGAVIPPNREFLAVLGDQKNGTNIETPLSTMVEAFRMALDQRENTADKAPIELSINGRLLARAVWDEQDKRYRQVK